MHTDRTHHHTDICIVGGGLTGLMMAVALSHTGYQITLLDQSNGHKPSQDGRTTTIHAAGQRMLATLDIWPHMSAPAAPVNAIHVATGPARSGLAARQRAPFELSWQGEKYPLGYVVENGALFDGLTHAITQTNITHITDRTITEMTHQGGRARLHAATINDTDEMLEIDCQLVVGCDGGNSPLRRNAGLRSLSTEAGQTAIVAVLQSAKSHEDAAYQRFLRSGPIALMPMAGQRISLVWTLPDAEAERLLICDTEAFNSAVSAAFGDYLGFLSLDGPRLKWPLRPSYTPTITAPNLVLAGDAAHAIHPLAGQGYNLALADAAVLADILVAGHKRGLPAGHSSSLADYAAGRRQEIAAMTATTAGLNALFSTAPARLAGVAGLGMALLNRTVFKKTLSQIAMGGILAKAALLDGTLPNGRM